MIRDEKARRENELKAVLGIVRNAGSMTGFLEDAESRLANLERSARLLADRADRDRAAGAMEDVFRDLHTLKGTSSTFGFDDLARAAGEAEAALADGGSGRAGVAGESVLKGLPALPELLSRVSSALEEIRALVRQVSGQGGTAPEPLAPLLRACHSLDHPTVGKAAEKYRSMIERVAHRLGKRIAFAAAPENLEMSPQAFAALDQPLVHLLRNAADHGIEAEGQRLLAGKNPVGRISLDLEVREDGLLVTVADDGRGIDVGKVAAKALALGLVEEGRLAAMTPEEKLGLIFPFGLTTRDQDNGISGRGVGMDAVAEWARAAGGRITVDSRPGEGTRMTLRLPPGFMGKGERGG